MHSVSNPGFRRKVAVLIPARNEELALPVLLKKILPMGWGQVMVVDNGSTDATAAVAQSFGVTLVQESRPGYGQACATGLESLDSSVEWVLFADVDAFSEWEAWPAFEELAQSGELELILGDRTASAKGRESLSPVQRWGNALACFLLAWLGRPAFRDLGPFRLIKLSALRDLEMRDRGFGWTVEMQALALLKKIPWKEISVPHSERKVGRSQIAGTLRGSWLAGRAILATLILALLEHFRPFKNVPSSLQQGLTFLFLLLGAGTVLFFGSYQGPDFAPPFLLGAGLLMLANLLALNAKAWPTRLFWLAVALPRLILLFHWPGEDTRDQLEMHGWLISKVLVVAADLCVAWVLMRYSRTVALVYGLNPLVLYSFAGAGYLDSLLLLPMVVGLLLFAQPDQNRSGLVGVCLGLVGVLNYVIAPLSIGLAGCYAKGREWPFLARFFFGFGIVVALVGLPLLFLFDNFDWYPEYPDEANRGAALFSWPGTFFAYAAMAVWCVLVLLWQKEKDQIGLWLILGILTMSPMVQGSFFTWLVAAAAVAKRFSVAVAASSSCWYFLMPHPVYTSGEWHWQLWNTTLLWGPILAVLLLSLFLRIPRGRPVLSRYDDAEAADNRASL